MAANNRVLREGVSAGLIGATAIAAWFGIIDAVQGHFFATPIMLGTSVASLVLKGAAPSATSAILVIPSSTSRCWSSSATAFRSS